MVFFLVAADDDSSAEKALLDAEELHEIDESPEMDKVELDLEDAPFLEEDDEDEDEDEDDEELEDTPGALEAVDEEGKKGLKDLLKDKRILIGGGAALLIVIGLLVFLLMPGGEPEEEPEPTPTPVPTATPEPTPDFVFEVQFEPFWIEYKTKDGNTRFLIFKFVAPTTNEKLSFEMGQKRLVLRDAVFYNLKNKDLAFLADKKNADQIKKDLLSVLNQYLNNGQLDKLLIQEYLVK